MDDLFKKRIIGKWSEGDSPYAISSFEEGGIFKAWIYEDSKKEKPLYSMKGKWWIEKGKLYNENFEITPSMPAHLKPGIIVVDTIIDITETVMILINGDGQQYSKTRMRE
jgi:hypoxanthine phosphoribosyltransferase